MKILSVHNYYQQSGGEDIVFEREANLLREAGHNVLTYIRSNKEIREMKPTQKASLPLQMIWSRKSYRDIYSLIGNEKPELVHFHNTHFMVSPSGYYACKAQGIPAIQSLHNPRLICPAATLYRNGKTCEACLNKTPPWPSVLYGCYRGSRIQTAGVAAMLTYHRWNKTWDEYVEKYIVFTNFYKHKFIQGGLPEEKIVIKPHFIEPDPLPRKNYPGSYALFIGRLDPEKGIHTLLNAWKKLNHIPLKIRGSGQLHAVVEQACNQNPNIELIDRLTENELHDLIKGAKFLVWPSEGYYETFGLVAVEAFACEVPVIASRIGVMEEIVTNDVTGLHFNPGDQDDLAEKVSWAWENSEKMVILGINGRHEFEEKYTAKQNYKKLMNIYHSVID